MSLLTTSQIYLRSCEKALDEFSSWHMEYAENISLSSVRKEGLDKLNKTKNLFNAIIKEALFDEDWKSYQTIRKSLHFFEEFLKNPSEKKDIKKKGFTHNESVNQTVLPETLSDPLCPILLDSIPKNLRFAFNNQIYNCYGFLLALLSQECAANGFLELKDPISRQSLFKAIPIYEGKENQPQIWDSSIQKTNKSMFTKEKTDKIFAYKLERVIDDPKCEESLKELLFKFGFSSLEEFFLIWKNALDLQQAEMGKIGSNIDEYFLASNKKEHEKNHSGIRRIEIQCFLLEQKEKQIFEQTQNAPDRLKALRIELFSKFLAKQKPKEHKILPKDFFPNTSSSPLSIFPFSFMKA
jgi:hypothetical protein